MGIKNTKEIKVVSNPRKDFGDMEELKASIEEHGILEPLLITKGKKLIAGERRLKAAKELGLKQVPVTIINSDMVEEIKLVENLQRKNLNPIEEGEAFKKYLKVRQEHANAKKYDRAKAVEQLAQKLGKKPDYIERRLMLTMATPKVQEALIKRKIQLGHAAVLARVDNKKQNSALKHIIDYDTSVNDVTDSLDDDIMKDLDRANFDKTGCKNCPYNGSEQTLLIDSGDVVKGNCLRPQCYLRKVSEWVQKETEVLKKQGIVVLTDEKIKEIKGAFEVNTYHEDKYKKAVNNLTKKPDMYVVVFHKPEYGDTIEKQIWQIKEESQRGQTKEQFSKAEEKRLNLSRKEKLQLKVRDFKRTFLINTSAELLKEGSKKAKVVILYSMIKGANYNNIFSRKRMEEILKDIKLKVPEWGGVDIKMDLLFALTESEIEVKIHQIAMNDLNEIYNVNVGIIAREAGVNLNKHFVITEEFLKLHTKDQLIGLAKELKIDVKGLVKNTDLTNKIVKGWKKGQIPKILGVL